MRAIQKRTLLPGVACLFVASLVSGTLFVQKTIAAYSGACSELSGVPGVLQRVGFIPKGGCEPPSNKKKGFCPPKACDANGKKGKCELRDGICVCVPKHISH